MCLIQVEISVSGSLAAPLIRILGLPPGAINQPLSYCIFSRFFFLKLLQGYQLSAAGVDIYRLRSCLKIPLKMLNLLLV